MPSSELPPDAPAESRSDPLAELFPATTGLASPADIPEFKAEPEPYPTASAFPPDPFSEPSPPHFPYPHPSPSPDRPASSERPVSPTPPPLEPSEAPPSEPPGSRLLQVGTAIVIGAMAANVIGFRYSRWAVGKDIHRAWETHQRNAGARARAASSDARRRAQAAHENARRAEREQSAQRASRAQRHDQQAKRDKDSRDQTRAFYAEWERAFGAGAAGSRQAGPQFWQQGFRVEFDPRVLEEMLRAQRGMAGRGNPFFMADDLIQEMLRAARAGQGAQGGGAKRRVEEEFDPFKFWEQMEGARWRTGGTQGGSGPAGVFQRQNLNRHYSVLGVDRSASDAQIKAAYRKEAMKWHPDRYRGGNPEEAARKFREITDAYNALSKK